VGGNNLGSVGGKVANEYIVGVVNIVRHECAIERFKRQETAIGADFRVEKQIRSTTSGSPGCSRREITDEQVSIV